MKARIAKYFNFSQRGTNFTAEVTGGLTSFLAVIYILVVNPALFMAAGMEFGEAFLATIVSIVMGTLFMGAVANYPIVIAPGLGINAYVVYTIVLKDGASWQSAIGCCFVASAIFLLLSMTRFRQELVNSIPESLKIGITAGIGMFIAFIGLKQGCIVVASSGTFVAMANMSDPMPMLTFIGVMLILVLQARGFKTAMLMSIIIMSAVAWCMGFLTIPASFISMPDSSFLSAVGGFSLVEVPHMIPELLMILLVTIFDTTGTIIGVGRRAGLIKDGKFPHLQTSLMADAFASFFGAIAGTGPSSSFAESAAGVSAGARTGFASVITGLLFIAAILLYPIAQALSAVPAITAPVLIIAGLQMMSEIRVLQETDMVEQMPAFITCIMMPLTYSITNGVAFGIISYIAIKVASGQGRNIHPLLYFFGVAFVLDMMEFL